jgi:hypothetical protein
VAPENTDLAPLGGLDNHYVIRDGSFWLCVHCRATWPYPAPVPRTSGPCGPRRVMRPPACSHPVSDWNGEDDTECVLPEGHVPTNLHADWWGNWATDDLDDVNEDEVPVPLRSLWLESR